MSKKYLLTIENFLKIEHAEIPLAPGVAGIVGANAQGKTTIITALQDLMSGTNDFSKVREGAERAVVKLDVFDDEGLVSSVQRVQTAKSNSLTGKGLRAGYTTTSFLQSILSDMAVNPILLTAGPVDYLKKHVQVPVDAADFPAGAQALLAKHKDEYEGLSAFVVAEFVAKELEAERLALRKTVDQKKAALIDLSMGMPPEMPPPPEDTQEAIKAAADDIQARRTQIAVLQERELAARRAVSLAIAQRNGIKTDCDLTAKRIEEGKAAIAAAQARLTALEEQATTLAERLTMANQDHDRLHDEAVAIKAPSSEELDQEAAAIETRKKALADYVAFQNRWLLVQQRAAEAVDLDDQWKALDGVVKTVKYEVPKTLIGKCDLGVEGLEIRDGEMYHNGHHMSRLSTAEKAVTTTKIALALAKKKGHIAVCLDGVESLDAEHRAEFLKAAEEAGVCVIYTRVGVPENSFEREMVNGKILEPANANATS